MALKNSLKMLALASSIALIAGCSSTGGGDYSGESHQDSEATTRGATATGISSGGFSSSELRERASSLGIEVDEQGIPLERTIYFAFDSDRIDGRYENILIGHANYLKANRDAKMVLQGHTDNRGTREYNMALGERRANSVRRFMMIMDVPQRQMSVVSYGEERPAVRGDSEEAHAKNRRVILRY
jgi:peptidoglycan-associated lipoprotein